MQINHRKLLQQPQSNQTLTCSDCGPTCPHKCSYPEIFWPPEPPPLPPHTTTTTAAATATTHLSPYIIIIAALLGSAFLFITYYLIMVRWSTRFRRPPAARISGDPEDLSDDDDPAFELDHPIWYITTVGLQPSVINSISTVKFKKDDDLIDGSDCSVCLSEFRDDETLRLLPKCNHAFHIPCIDTWLRSHTNCPLCRAGILSNGLSAVLSPGDRSVSRGRVELDANTPMEVSVLSENVGEVDRNVGLEGETGEETEDSKAEHESATAARMSISVDARD